MSGLISRRTMRELQQEADRAGDGYPWQEITVAICKEPLDEEKLFEQGLRAQRDWIARGGRETPKPGVRSRGKRGLANLLARLIFFTLYTCAVIGLLTLLEAKWPQTNIYEVFEPFTDWVQGLLGGG